MVINRSRVKEIVGALQVSSDFYDALDQHTESIIKKACDRAVANNRRTVMARDI